MKHLATLTNEELLSLDSEEARKELIKRPKALKRVYKETEKMVERPPQSWVLGQDIYKHPDRKKGLQGSLDPRMEMLMKKEVIVWTEKLS